MKTIDATPRAALLVESMRDVGYALPSALADIIDNSIAAGATTVQLLVDPRATYIAVVDDGRGMSEEELYEIMRPGSRGRSPDKGEVDLGRFGLGLKSASFSQCRRLTVVTRQLGQTAAATWDLDYVVAEDKWLLQVPTSYDGLPGVGMLGTSGTVVLWQLLDRIGGQDDDERGLEEYTTLVDEAREHLELVFHRYLAGERGLRKINVILNSKPLLPHDPFHEQHPKTMASPEDRIGTAKRLVTLRAFTLPHHNALTQAEWEKQGGPAGHLRNQGFYLYRQKRLIIHGTWFGLLKMGELTKLTRVRVDVGSEQDHEWKVDIKKASAHPPAAVKRRLRALVETISIPSRRIYTGRAKKRAETAKLPVWIRMQDQERIAYLVNREHPMVTRLAQLHTPEGVEHLDQLLTMIGAALPVEMLFADVSEDPLAIDVKNLGEDAVRFMAETTASQLMQANMAGKDVLTAMLTSEPFRSFPDLVRLTVQRLSGETHG